MTTLNSQSTRTVLQIKTLKRIQNVTVNHSTGCHSHSIKYTISHSQSQAIVIQSSTVQSVIVSHGRLQLALRNVAVGAVSCTLPAETRRRCELVLLGRPVACQPPQLHLHKSTPQYYLPSLILCVVNNNYMHTRKIGQFLTARLVTNEMKKAPRDANTARARALAVP